MMQIFEISAKHLSPQIWAERAVNAMLNEAFERGDLELNLDLEEAFI